LLKWSSLARARVETGPPFRFLPREGALLSLEEDLGCAKAEVEKEAEEDKGLSWEEAKHRGSEDAAEKEESLAAIMAAMKKQQKQKKPRRRAEMELLALSSF
jgi:hypothetical protein